MYVVEKTGIACQIYILPTWENFWHDTPISSATLRVDIKLHYHTMPMKWLLSSLNPENGVKIQGGLSTPIHQFVSMISSLPHTQQTQGRADNPVQKSTTEHLFYTATHLVLSKFTIFFFSNNGPK